MSGAEHERLTSLLRKGSVTILGGPQGAEVAKLLADQAASGVLMEPRDLSGLRAFQVPTGADLAWNKAVTTIILIPQGWSPDDVRAAFVLADAAIYAEGGYLYAVKGGEPNAKPIPLKELVS